MDLKLLEFAHDNHSALFGIGRHDLAELTEPSASGHHRSSVVTACGWNTAHVWVMDFQVGRAVLLDIMDLDPLRVSMALGDDFGSPMFHELLNFLAEHFRRAGGDWWIDLPRVAQR